MPERIKGYCREDENGDYTVILNSRLTYEENLKTYKHEINHGLNDDFNSAKSINEIELDNHKR
jgi:hypothetical protein